MPRCDEHKVLGVSWNPGSDQLIFVITGLAHLAQSLRSTKRGSIGLIGRFYDPLGYLSPVIIRFKLILQELYKNKVDWDETVSDELLNKWRILVTDLSDATRIYLPRCYFGDVMGQSHSITFTGVCDASTRAYAAVIYLQIKTGTSNVLRPRMRSYKLKP